jgi:acetylornithine deacetylase/succinyl-diaminopimelate desuccinylase-like protein
MPDEKLSNYIASQSEPATALLTALVRTPSDNPPGDCAPHAETAAALLESWGFTVERHPVPQNLVQSQGMASCTNLVIRQKFGPGPTIALNAHGDVVPPGEGWTHPPYGAEIHQNWLYGRGAAVSKSDFVTYALALRALIETNQTLAGTVELHFTYDEETGGELGPAWLLAEGISKPDYAICAGFSYAAVTAHNGCLHLEVTVTGKSAHAAKPETGHDALHAATIILTALYAERDRLTAEISSFPGIGSKKLTIGLITGGINTNVVPDKVTLRLDRRLIPDESPEAAESSLRALIQSAASLPGISVRISRILLATPLVPLPGADRLAGVLCRHATEIFGETIAATGSPLYTDARHYAAANIPVILYGAGPKTIELANAHRADERLYLPDLPKAAEVIAQTLRDLLVSPPP